MCVCVIHSNREQGEHTKYGYMKALMHWRVNVILNHRSQNMSLFTANCTCGNQVTYSI